PRCLAAAMTVHTTTGERLHPDVLPDGFVLTTGTEDDLDTMTELMYTKPGSGDGPRVQVSRVRTTAPLEQLTAGAHHAATIQGAPGAISDGDPAGEFRSVSWEPAPATIVIVTGYKLTASELVNIAQHMRYTA